MLFLCGDTTGNESWLALGDECGVVKVVRWQTSRASGEILLKLKKLLGTKRPEKLGVVTGPGGFTQARVGVVVFNAMARGWGIPIVGVVGSREPEEMLELVHKEKGEAAVEVYYAYAPHITARKNII